MATLAILLLFSCVHEAAGGGSWVYAHAGQREADASAQAETWGGLCTSGREQSPIDIVTVNAAKTSKPAIETHFNTSESYVKNTGHGFQLFETSPVSYVYNSSEADQLSEWNMTSGAKGYSMIGGSKYNFYQVHWHSPSENTIDGQHLALEAHFVHQLADAALEGTYHRLAVIGLMYELGTDSQCNAFLDLFWSNFTEEAGISAYTGNDFDLNNMLASKLSEGYWHWYGSLTTPPCTEGVSWNLMRKTEKVCQRQVNKLKQALAATQHGIDFNNRVTQPLNNRVVVELSPDGPDLPPSSLNPVLVTGGHWLYAETGETTSDDSVQDATWGGLCVTGLEQSPINIVAADVKVASSTAVISTHYATSLTYVKNTGHGFQIFETRPQDTTLQNGTVLPVSNSNVSAKGYSMISGERFNFYQVHWHTPSENTIDGKHFAVEAHFVHQLNDPALHGTYHRLAVLALLYDLGDACNTFLDNFWSAFPLDVGNSKYTGANVDLNQHLTEQLAGSYYHWYGSLTTPPCTEGVSWNLLSLPGKVCQRQVDQLKLALSTTQHHIDFNNRATQPLNYRVVTRTSHPLADAGSFAEALTEVEPKICEQGGRGLFFPLLESEHEWSRWLRAALYLFCMLYIFYGVSIVSDKFMDAIMTITSWKRRVRLQGSERIVTVTVWNRTIANLSLIAMGTSAPELLLSIIEIFTGHFYSGDLGPSTIVGSAAFNLFIICALCIVTIPDGQTRHIDNLNVFYVTAIFSLLAYIWLVFMLTVTTPDCVDIVEGCVTLVMFLLLLFVSYLTDIGYIRLDGKPKPTDADVAVALSKVDPSTAAGATRFLQLREQVRILEEQQRRVASAIGCPEPSFVDREVIDQKGFAIVAPNGVLTFSSDTLVVQGGLLHKTVVVPVYRKNGVLGEVRCSYHTENLNAVAGYDFEECSGELVFQQGVTCMDISLQILNKTLGEHSDSFQLVLDNVKGGAICNPNSDGGRDKSILTITILNEGERLAMQSVGLRLTYCFDGIFNMDACRVSAAVWRRNIVDAIFDTGAEDGEPPTARQLVMHAVALPWKIVFAFAVPPCELAGGWLAFSLALGMIGLITAVLIDFAELFGCVAHIEDTITALTLVAIGTSLPDTFASVLAARQDEYADASIVNVTGSNSVNVFVGIGIPWTIAAIYWRTVGATEEWRRKYSSYLADYPNGGFIVPAGDLTYSTVVFLIGASIALVMFHLRRRKLGGELGGPVALKWMSFLLLILLFIMYLVLAIWKIQNPDATLLSQFIAIVIALVVLENLLLLIYAVFLYRSRQARFTKLPSDVEAACSVGAPTPMGSIFVGSHPVTAGALGKAASKHGKGEPGLRQAADVMTDELKFLDAESSAVPLGVLGLVILMVARLKRRVKARRGRLSASDARYSSLRPTVASGQPDSFYLQRLRRRDESPFRQQGAERPRIPSFHSLPDLL